MQICVLTNSFSLDLQVLVHRYNFVELCRVLVRGEVFLERLEIVSAVDTMSQSGLARTHLVDSQIFRDEVVS